MNGTLSFGFRQTLMIEGGKYHDSLEELFTLQNIAELRVISYKVFTFDFGFNVLDSRFSVRLYT